MLGKLLKHEFRATGRIMLPLLAAELLLAVFAGISARGLNNLHGGLLRAMYMMTLFAFFLALFAVGVVAVVLMIQRFYKNLLRDEGYLSMTLPVTVDEHIWAKLIVSFVWFAAVGLLSAASMSLVVAIGSEVPMFDMSFQSFAEGFPVDFGELGALHGLLFALELLLICFLGTSTVCLRCYASMAVGCSAADHKLLLSFVTYLGIGIVLSVMRNTFFFGVLPNLNLSGFVTGDFLSHMGAALVHGAMWSVILGLAVYCAVFYFVTRWFLKNKLNLA